MLLTMPRLGSDFRMKTPIRLWTTPISIKSKLRRVLKKKKVEKMPKLMRILKMEKMFLRKLSTLSFAVVFSISAKMPRMMTLNQVVKRSQSKKSKRTFLGFMRNGTRLLLQISSLISNQLWLNFTVIFSVRRR